MCEQEVIRMGSINGSNKYTYVALPEFFGQDGTLKLEHHPTPESLPQKNKNGNSIEWKGGVVKS